MKNFLASLLLLAGCSVFSQSSHEAAKKLLDEANATFKKQETVDIRFTYTFENDRVTPPIKQVESGEVQVKGASFRLVLMGNEQISDGTTIYTILHEDEEVQKSSANSENPDEESFHPLQILDSYKEGYSFKLGGKETKAGKQVQYVVLVPTASELLERVTVGIYRTSKQLFSYEQLAMDGTVTKFVVDSYNANSNLSEATFRFDPSKYPDYYIPN